MTAYRWLKALLVSRLEAGLIDIEWHRINRYIENRKEN